MSGLGPTLRWWCHLPKPRIASTRLRGALVMRGLRERGLDADWFDPEQPAPQVLVLAKRYGAHSLDTAQRLQQQGTRIVLDLCDNRFAETAAATGPDEDRASLDRALTLADRIVASTPTLAAVIAAHQRQPAPVSVIGDLADDLSIISNRPGERLLAKLAIAGPRLRLEALRFGGRTGLVWFGNHGGPYSQGGMDDLRRLRDSLHEIDGRHPLFLSVISNNRGRYRDLVAGWRLPTLYFKWNHVSFPALLAQHRIALVPVTANAFNDCKTDNRLVTAFGAGLAVAADLIPSYEPYREALPEGSWTEKLDTLLGDPAPSARRVAIGQQIARASSDPVRILDRWADVLLGGRQ